MFTRARILLLKADVGEWGPGWPDEKIADELDVSVLTVERVRKQLVEKGLEAVLRRRKYVQKVSRKKLDGEAGAHLIALACRESPEGSARWSLRLLADRMIELGYVDSISHEAVRRVLKKRIKTLAAPTVVHPIASKCRFCVRHGGHSDGVYPGLQPR
jgi:transposase